MLACKTFSVFGAGNLGCKLAAALVQNGSNSINRSNRSNSSNSFTLYNALTRFKLGYIYKKSKENRFQTAIETDIGKIIAASDVVFIPVQESKIRQVAELIAHSSEPAGKVFFHMSNSLTSDELTALKEKGGLVASFSPLQTFADTGLDDAGSIFAGIYFLGEGDEAALAVAQELAGSLQAHLLTVAKEEKVYFHIAGIAAANFLIAILKLAERQLKKIASSHTGSQSPPLSLNILMPLIEQTLENVRQKGVEASLTGPVKRKEMGIVNRHISLLPPDEAELYRVLSQFLSS